MKHLPFLALLLPTLLFAQTAKWDGTTRNTAWYTSNASADTFTISTAEQLAGLAQLVNRINNPVNFSGKTILLANDIDLGEKSWTPIGNSTACTFQGIFDGQSHVISGLHVSDAYYAGLFGRVNGAEIKDVGVSGDVYGTGNYTGGLVGQMYGGSSITGSYASGDVYGTGDCTGGLVGSMSGGSITGSYASGDVSSSGWSTGGLVGRIQSSSTITGSYASGDVYGSSTGGSSWTGGLVGLMEGGITGSYYDCETSGKSCSGDGKTTAEMKTQSTYEGWDFTSTWKIDPLLNGGYPILKQLPFDANKLVHLQITIANQRLRNGSIPTIIVPHTGDSIKPTVNSVIFNGKTLVQGTDYTITYADNVDISTAENPAKIIIQGIGTYHGKKTFKFYIIPATPRNIASVTVDSVPDQLWTGSAVRPKVTVKETIAGYSITLREASTPSDDNADYWLSYVNNTDSTTSSNPKATVQITGRGPYLGSSTTAGFKIIGKKPLNGKATISNTISAATYDGTQHRPNIVVTHNDDGTLVEGRDYTVSYGANINAGTNAGTVTANGIGNYSGSISKTFTINPKPLTEGMVPTVPGHQYTGFDIEPQITVKDGEKTLAPGTDYTVKYADNKEPYEWAHVSITGAGNYTGIINRYFEIYEGAGTARDTVVVVWIGTTEFIYNTAEQKPQANATLKKDGSSVNIRIEGGATDARTAAYKAIAVFPDPASSVTKILVNDTMPFRILKASIAPTLSVTDTKAGTPPNPQLSGVIDKTAKVEYWYSASKDNGYTTTVPSTAGVYFVKAVIPSTNNYNEATTEPVSFAVTGINTTKIPVEWGSESVFTYNGKAQSPTASVNGYYVTVNGATDAGTHTATAKLANSDPALELTNATKNFTIKPKPLAEEAIDPIPNFLFEGYKIEPEFVWVRDGVCNFSSNNMSHRLYNSLSTRIPSHFHLL